MEICRFSLMEIDGNGGLQILLDGNGRKRNFRFHFFRLAVTQKRKNRHYFNEKLQTTITFQMIFKFNIFYFDGKILICALQ